MWRLSLSNPGDTRLAERRERGRVNTTDAQAIDEAGSATRQALNIYGRIRSSMTDARGDVSAVATIRQALEAAENAGDADALAALLTDDAVLMVPDFPAQEGKTACVQFVRGI